MSRDRVVVVAASLTVIFVFTVAGVVAIAVAVPEGGNPGSLISLLLASLAPTVAALISIAKISDVEGKVNDLSNGKMDRKIREGVAQVLDEKFSPHTQLTAKSTPKLRRFFNLER